MLLPNAYVNSEILEAERKVFLNSVWFFVGFKTDIPNNLDFFTLKIFGIELVVQNFEGNVRAFQNTCAHRGSRILCTQKGNSPLRCAYHGWTYNKEGLATGIPLKKTFPELNEVKDIGTPRLRSFKVESCGDLLFASGGETPVSLKDYLGPLYFEIENIGSALGSLIDVNPMTIKSNWKVVVENTLESYHVDFAHPNFKNFVSPQHEVKIRAGLHSKSDFEIKPAALEKWDRIKKHFDSRPLHLTGYHHYFIFPNLTIASTFGNSFAFQRISDMSCDETFFESRVFLTKLQKEPSILQKTILTTLSDSIVAFNRQVFEEDKPLCENMQIGLSQNPPNLIFSQIEERIAWFSDSWASVVNPLPNVKSHEPNSKEPPRVQI